METGVRCPLDVTTEIELQGLGEVLFSWPSHEERLKRLAMFFERYKNLTALYEPDARCAGEQALSSHDDLFEMIRILKRNPDVTRKNFAEALFADRDGRAVPPVADQQRAITLVVEVMFMMNCSSQGPRPDIRSLEFGIRKTGWKDNITLVQFISGEFSMIDHPVINSEDVAFSAEMKFALKARNLKKLAGLKFCATDDLRNHLVIEQRTGTVNIFHHTAFLKEHLRLSKDAPRGLSVSQYLKRGALPRQLVLEALDSIQKILFPLSDAKSYSLLQSLTSTDSFDPDCLRFESASIRDAEEKDIQYLYFGSRLADLYEELENPKPRGWAVKWLERKSGARYVMMATLIGVAIAVTLGFAALAVSSYQTYIAYQQWKHPVV